MQTRLIKNAQRKQTVFLHRGIYRWTNFLTLDIRPHTNVSFPKICLLFLLYFLILLFFFFFFYKKNSFFQTRYSIIFDQTLILPTFIFFFFKILISLNSSQSISHIVLFRRLFFFFPLYLSLMI